MCLFVSFWTYYLKLEYILILLNVSELLDTIEESEPLTGYGMFQITRGLLTSMISTSITYLIVLVQFKMANV